MSELFQKLLNLFLQSFGKIENHTKPPELDGGAPSTKVYGPPPPEATVSPEGIKLPEWAKDWNKKPETPWSVANEILERPFQPVGRIVPTRRYPLKDSTGKIIVPGVYSVYGRAPEEEGNKDYPKAKLKVHEKLPGTWNNGKPRLYMEVSAGEHLREALTRAEEMEKRLKSKILSYITAIGAYNHRGIRHDEDGELSYHSWAIACDIDAAKNRAVSKSKTWQKRSGTSWVACAPHEAQRGPIHTILPFSKQFYEVFPKAMPVELVFAFKSVFFSWGGDWGRAKWHAVLGKFGIGYDQEDPVVAKTDIFLAAMKEWSTITYMDGMHFELVLRGNWAEAHYARNSKP